MELRNINLINFTRNNIHRRVSYQFHWRRSHKNVNPSVKNQKNQRQINKVQDTERQRNITPKKDQLLPKRQRRFTFGMKTREKILTRIIEKKNNDLYHRNSFTKCTPPLIRFIKHGPTKLSNTSKQYLEGKNYDRIFILIFLKADFLILQVLRKLSR